MIIAKKKGLGFVQRSRLRIGTMWRDLRKKGLHKAAGEWIPMLTGAALTLYLFWSFFLSPLLDQSSALLTGANGEGGAQVAAFKVLKEGARHPLAFFTALKSQQQQQQSESESEMKQSEVKQTGTVQNYGGGHGAEGFIPERTDVDWLLNKSASIDPLLDTSFALGNKIVDWDEQRRLWKQERGMSDHGDGDDTKKQKVLMVTGSQPAPCQNLMGDHMLVRSLKNKVDYARLHGLELFCNTATLSKALPSWWVKLPLLRSLMLSRPDVEWLWWADSDAVLTDMSFLPPFERYEGKNLIIHGWDHLVYEERRWTGLNMGVFLVRNCQWTLDLFDELAPMGVAGETGDRIGKILTLSLSGRPASFESDDQGAFIYLLNAQRHRWAQGVLLENSYHLNGYWKDIAERFEQLQADSKPGFGDERWPLITHFTGCQICSGRINGVYTAEECTTQMERALNLADDQVLAHLGYRHVALSASGVEPTTAG